MQDIILLSLTSICYKIIYIYDTFLKPSIELLLAEIVEFINDDNYLQWYMRKNKTNKVLIISISLLLVTMDGREKNNIKHSN